jgi:hypothetical protein
MLKQIVISGLFAATIVAGTHTSNYSFTTSAGRKVVLQYCHHDCAQLFRTPSQPCCDVFEKAMQGDHAALLRVFTERGLHSGDNESWSFTAWPLLHVVGDKHFAAFLRSLNARQQADVFEQIFYEGSYYPEAVGSGYFTRHFPRGRGYLPQAAATKSI